MWYFHACMCIGLLTSATVDPSKPLPYWDKVGYCPIKRFIHEPAPSCLLLCILYLRSCHHNAHVHVYYGSENGTCHEIRQICTWVLRVILFLFLSFVFCSMEPFTWWQMRWDWFSHRPLTPTTWWSTWSWWWTILMCSYSQIVSWIQNTVNLLQ